jgi:hypothetical protein
MEQSNQLPDKRYEEISLKELLLKLVEWWRYLLGKWLIIGIFGIIGAGLGILYAVSKKPNYSAELTFILEENKSSSLGAYAGLASQFGLDLGGGGGSGIFAGDNILEFLKSRFMVEKALLSPVNVDGKTISLAELYIRINHFRDTWKEDKTLSVIQFPPMPDRKSFTRQQDSLLSIFYQDITKKNLTVSKPDKKLSFVSVVCLSGDERFSKEFTERLVVESVDFYVRTKTKKSQANVDILQMKADSLIRLLNQKTYSAAEQADLNQNPIRRMASVGSEVASRDKMIIQTVYGEVVKNLELSRMSMAQETPVIQIIDSPILPLEKVKLGKLKGLIIGGFLGAGLMIFYLLIRKIIREIMI